MGNSPFTIDLGMLQKMISCRAFSSISLSMSPACSSPSSTSTFDNEDWYTLPDMLPGDLHSSLRCIGHSDAVATFICGGIWPNKASKPIKCYLLPEMTIRLVHFRHLMTFNRADTTVHFCTFKFMSFHGIYQAQYRLRFRPLEEFYWHTSASYWSGNLNSSIRCTRSFELAVLVFDTNLHNILLLVASR
jgi:hypothetical protein